MTVFGLDTGDAATWVGSVLTGLSVAGAAGYYVIDREATKKAQASSVVCWIDGDDMSPTIHVDNLSKEPIFRPTIECVSRRGASRRPQRHLADGDCCHQHKLYDKSDRVDIDAGKRTSTPIKLRAPYSRYLITINFTDANSRSWCKNVATSKAKRRFCVWYRRGHFQSPRVARSVANGDDA
jgi:hypothetical protein